MLGEIEAFKNPVVVIFSWCGFPAILKIISLKENKIMDFAVNES